jgi:hypothetical protein
LSVLRIVRPVRLGIWGLLGILLLSVVATGSGVAHPTASEPGAPAPNSGCPGSPIATSYTGSVTIEGGPLNGTATENVSILDNYSADVQETNRSTGAVISLVCQLFTGGTTSGANSSFALSLALPPEHCYPTECTTVTGPYGPLGVAPSVAPPAGYGTVSRVNGTRVNVSLIAELGGLVLDPTGGSRVLSPDAPGAFVATATNAIGQPSPLSPTIAWNLSGTGWSFVGSSSGRNVTVEALPDAGVGRLSVTASSKVGTNRFEAGPDRVNLAAVSTAFTGGEANQTSVDTGGVVEFTVDGTGAAGYNYSAVAAPGLGLAPVGWGCSESPSMAGSVSLVCTGSVAYPSAGIAEPSAQLTNSYSTADGSLPPITVAPAPEITVQPGSPVGYIDAPLSIRVSVAPGAGTAPYSMACLAPGVGPALCTATAGPNWTFAPVYSRVGNYSALAWAVDRDGRNISLPVPVTIVSPLSLAPIAAPPSVLADAPENFSAHLAGGDLPLRYWWNDSGATIAGGVVGTDGTLDVTWVPTIPGETDLSLTAEDSLGTSSTVSSIVNVGPAVATNLAAVAVPGAAPSVAGAPVALAWQAVDLQGRNVSDFVSAGSLRITPDEGTLPVELWANASGGVALAGSSGTFTVPTSAWNLGRLSLTVAIARAGTFTLQLEGAGLLARTDALDLTVVADLGHLHLYSPRIAQSGARVNRTFWLLADRYGNPAEGAAVDIFYSSEGTSSESIFTERSAGNGTAGVWVNYSAPTTAGGTLEVTDPIGGMVLLGPIAIPPALSDAAPLSGPIVTLAAAAPVGAVGVGLTAWAQRRRRVGTAPDELPPDEDLRQMVEGRDRVISLVRDARAIDLADLESAWGSSPAPPELADWVASLVADGTLGARTGPDGVARFCLIAGADGPPIVLLDPDALARAEAARRELTEEADAGPDA